MSESHPSQKRYPPELKERAVRMVQETIALEGRRLGVITRIARQLGIGSESLRLWVRQAEVDRGERPGLSSDDRQRIVELERENRASPRQRDPEGSLGFLRVSVTLRGVRGQRQADQASGGSLVSSLPRPAVVCPGPAAPRTSGVA
jgi:transposase